MQRREGVGRLGSVCVGGTTLSVVEGCSLAKILKFILGRGVHNKHEDDRGLCVRKQCVICEVTMGVLIY